MTTPPTSSVVDFFAIEAGEYLDRLDALLGDAHTDQPPDADALGRAARALRGSASIARHPELTELAAAIEQAAAGLRTGAVRWTTQTADAFTAAVDEYRALLRAVRSWGAADADRARRRTTELRALVPDDDAAAPRPARIVPVSALFHDDAGPHLVHRAPSPPITADQRFRQAAVPLASTLRRLIADGRRADGSTDAARQSVGEDLRGALRDLRELAESYGITPVVNFAAAREEPLARLERQALDTVESAAGALIESAGTAWARPTPPASAPAVRGTVTPPGGTAAAPTRPPTPAAMPAVSAADASTAAPAAEPATATTPRTPPTGQALVDLLETSISGISQIGTAPLDGGAREESSEEIVPVGTLLYRGRRALDRAREVRDALRAAPAPDPTLLAELYDLIDLAASG
jgi:chemotaxis protein histidine kinase CheA